MKRIHDIPRLLLRIKKVEATYLEWFRLYKSLESALPIIDYLISFTKMKIIDNIYMKCY